MAAMKYGSFSTSKSAIVAVLAAGAALLCGHPVTATQLQRAAGSEPKSVARVVELLRDLSAKVKEEGGTEQAEYDKYACWCSDTLKRKSEDIAEAKSSIERLEAENVKLSGEIATHGTKVEQLNEDVGENKASQKEAQDNRQNENEAFDEQMKESEQCSGALEAAITALTGAGTKKKFLQTIQEAQVLSAAAGIRSVLQRPDVLQRFSDSDIQAVRSFVERPGEYMGDAHGSGNSGVSAMQVHHKTASHENPFGDYAPRSTVIQGILKDMYGTFAKDMEKANAAEAEQAKVHQELMATKIAELATLETDLLHHQMAFAEKEKKKGDNVVLLDETNVQLAADETFFADTKSGCQQKASMWSERTRLRTLELEGIVQAIAILDDGSVIFEHAVRTSNATTVTDVAMTLLQVARNAARRSGRFDKIIADIDDMIALLRKEEQDDVAHRDRCEAATGKNANDIEDYTHHIELKGQLIEKSENADKKLDTELSLLQREIKEDNETIAALQSKRVAERTNFETSLEYDVQAVALLEQAIIALSNFYASEGIPLSLLRKSQAAYPVDPDKAPATNWTDGKYGGKKSETRGIVAILEMIKENFEKEIKTAREADAAAELKFQKQHTDLKSSLHAKHQLDLKMNEEKLDLKQKIADVETDKSVLEGNLNNEKKLGDALETDCAWVESHFDSRREKRKAEIDGLTSAKEVLAEGNK